MISVLLLCGCNTFIARQAKAPRLYTGVKYDIELYPVLEKKIDSPIIAPIAYLSVWIYTGVALVADAVFDTLALPYDNYQMNKGLEKPLDPNRESWRHYSRHYEGFTVTFDLPPADENSIFSDGNLAEPRLSFLLFDCNYDFKSNISGYGISAFFSDVGVTYKSYRKSLLEKTNKQIVEIKDSEISGLKAYEVTIYADSLRKNPLLESFVIFLDNKTILKIETHLNKDIYDSDEAILDKRAVTRDILSRLKIEVSK